MENASSTVATSGYFCSLLEYVNISEIKCNIQNVRIHHFHTNCMPANSNQWLTAVGSGYDLFAYIHDTEHGKIFKVHFLILTR